MANFSDYDGNFVPEAKKSLEELPEIAVLGYVETESFIYESAACFGNINFW